VEYGGAHLDRSALNEESWDYVALGHYHNATRIAPNVWYAGSTERTATNIWAEAETRKGWVLYDSETRTGEFRDVRTREVVDLPRFSARRATAGPPPTPTASGFEEASGEAGSAGDTGVTGGDPGDGGDRGDVGDGGNEEGRASGFRTGDDWLTAEEIDGRIRAAVDGLPDGVAGKIVRLVITDVPRELFRELDHRQIRELKAEALHFQLDARRPEVRRRAISEETRRRTLEEELELFLADWEPSTPGVDRDRLLTLGAAYLAATEDWREDVLELPLDEPGGGSGGGASEAEGASA
jgi:DNA repair exonuclease SbcCD nuclease subunit